MSPVNGEPQLTHESSEVRQLRAELLTMRDKVERLINRLELASFARATAMVATSNEVLPGNGRLPKLNSLMHTDNGYSSYTRLCVPVIMLFVVACSLVSYLLGGLLFCWLVVVVNDWFLQFLSTECIQQI